MENNQEVKKDRSRLLFLNAMLVMTTGMTLEEAVEIAAKEDSDEAMQEALMKAFIEKQKERVTPT